MAAAKISYGEATSLQEQLVAEDMTTYGPELAHIYHAVSHLLHLNNEHDASISKSKSSVDIHKKLLLENPTSIKIRSDLAGSYNMLAVSQRVNVPKDAIASGERCVELLTALLDENPELIEHQGCLASISSAERASIRWAEPFRTLAFFGVRSSVN